MAPMGSMQTRVEAGADGRRLEAGALPVSDMPGLLDGTAWRDAALVWLGQRLLLGALMFVGIRLLGVSQRGWRLSHILANWDGDIYRNIASGGYAHLWQAAFFPLYPLLEHVLAVVTGGDTAVAGVIIANVACLVAFGLLRVLVERELGRAIARRTLLYIAIFPVSFFLVAAYAESLFLLLSVGAFLALRRERWVVAGVLIALATLTRPVGILLELALITQYVAVRRAGLSSVIGAMVRLVRARGRSRGGWLQSRLGVPAGTAKPSYGGWGTAASQVESTPSKATGAMRSGDTSSGASRGILVELWREGRGLIAPALLPVAAIAGFCLYLYPRFHTLTAPSAAESANWGRRLSWPWDGFAQAGGALLHGPFPFRLHAALDIGFTLLFLAVAALAVRWMPLCYALPGCATAVLALLTPMHTYDWVGLGSNVRFMLVLFPLFMLLAWWGEERRAVHLAICSWSLLLLVLLTFEFVGGAFVA